MLEFPIESVQSSNSFEGQKPIVPLSILMAEDHFLNQISTKKVLQSWSDNVTVEIAENGKIALDKVSEQKYDLILMDIQMPEMDGYRATAAIRKLDDPIKRDVPIIALTASAFLTHEDKAKLFGMNEHVGKPFSPDELIEKIDKLLKIHSRKER